MATEADHQALHLAQLAGALWGAPAQDVNTTGLMAAVAAAMPAIWSIARTRVTFPGSLPYLAKIEAIDLCLGQVRTAVDADLGPLNIKQSHVFRNLLDLRKAAQEELVRVEARASKSFRPAIGPILAKAPVEVTRATVRVELVDGVWVARVERIPLRPDPNDPAYSGDPLYRRPGTYDPTLPPR